MVQALITERYAADIAGVLNCYDRIVVSGHLGAICYAKGMTKYLYAQGVRIFDYAKFAEPLRDEIRQNAKAIAESAGIEIEFITKHNSFRKEERIQEILQERGNQAGLVHIFSAMESCPTYEPWHDKGNGKTFLRATQGKCLHYYFYFIDELLGLCYLRVPTWSPFRLQFYCNGHKCYNWSIMQAEYATDIIFRNQAALQRFYPHLVETLIQAVKPADIATFLGRKLHSNYQDEMGNRFNRRWLGTRIKHTMGPVTIKMYDKFNLSLAY